MEHLLKHGYQTSGPAIIKIILIILETTVVCGTRAHFTS